MELRQLEYSVAVAEEANFTRAAERVHISQSGVSAQIASSSGSSRHVDRPLGRRRAAAAGAAALPHARGVLAAATAVRRAVDEVTGLVRGRLEVGMVTGCTVTPLFEALAAFRGAHPGVELALLEDNSERLLERLRAGELDLGLVGLAGAPPPDLEAMTIVSERLIAAVAPRHPLAARTRTTLGEVATYPSCACRRDRPPAVFDQACRARGLSPEIALEASAQPAIADLAAAVSASASSASRCSSVRGCPRHHRRHRASRGPGPGLARRQQPRAERTAVVLPPSVRAPSRRRLNRHQPTEIRLMNHQVRLAARPTGLPKPSDWELTSEPVPTRRLASSW